MSLYSVDAEASVVGAAIMDGSLVADLAEIVRPRDFAGAGYRTVWSAILNLTKQGQAVDLLTLSDHLEANGLIEQVGGMSGLTVMAQSVPSTANAAAYAEIVADLAQRRALVEALPDTEAGFNDRTIPTDTLITQMQARLESMRRQGRDELLRAGEYLSAEFIDPLDARFNGEAEAMGLSYGLRDLDEMTLGMKPSELVIVGGRPSMGKTAFMMNSLRSALNSGKPVLVESLEMKRPALFNRLVAGIGDIPIAALQDPANNDMDEHWPRLSHPVNQINSADLYINDSTPRSISQIRAQVKALHERHGSVGLVMIDYLGKVKVEGDYHGRHDRAIEEVVAGAKDIAKEFDCPVMLLSQLNRKLEERADKRPTMGDLKDSSAIEQEADTILFLYRDEVYHPDNPDSRGLAEIIIGKQREGRIGTVNVVSRLANARFEDLAASHYSEGAFA